MTSDPQPDRLALLLAEEVLQAIYGDDLQGCTVSLERVGEVIAKGMAQIENSSRELQGLYEKVVEAVHLLSTAPDVSKVSDPIELQKLLSERLDAIHGITGKTMETTKKVKNKGGR
jgi:hypothetical protein